LNNFCENTEPGKLMTKSRPLIGITCDTNSREEARLRWQLRADYTAAIVAAGGTPVMLPGEVECIGDYLSRCDGIILSGGDDVDTRPFGEPVHPKANLMRPERQRFELALLSALDTAATPVLGICLGMQMMAIHAGGKLHQHLPEAPGFDEQRASLHQQKDHGLKLISPHPALPAAALVHSSHHQAVASPGSLKVVALSDADSGGVIEAVAREGDRRFYLGVQWHPERTADPTLGVNLIGRLVEAARRAT
jgi:putative glutamine amidotransferase